MTFHVHCLYQLDDDVWMRGLIHESHKCVVDQGYSELASYNNGSTNVESLQVQTSEKSGTHQHAEERECNTFPNQVCLDILHCIIDVTDLLLSCNLTVQHGEVHLSLVDGKTSCGISLHDLGLVGTIESRIK